MRKEYEILKKKIYDSFAEKDTILLVSMFMVLYIEYRQKHSINKKEYDLLTDLAYYAWGLLRKETE